MIPEGSLPGIGWATQPNMFLAPALAHSMWSPLFVGALKCNAEAYAGCRTIASEWQNFVSARVREDVVLMQRVAQSRTPDQVSAAYADFWQRAVEDYGKEYVVMGRLVAGLTSKVMAAAQSVAEEVRADAARSSRIG